MDVPISISTFNENLLQQIGANSLDDITVRTPNFYSLQQGEAKSTPPSIRGIGSRSSAGSDPAVGFYIDEVYLGNQVGSMFDLFDIEQIEVLRGPQGTLFGRNSIGGVVNITSVKPSDDFIGRFSASAGNFDAIRIKGMISGPLIEDKLAGKISGVYNDRDGFIENRFDGGTLKAEHNWSLRGQLRFTPTDELEMTLTGDYREVDQNAGGYESLTQNPAFAGAIPSLTFIIDDPFNYSVSWNQPGLETLEAWGVSLNTKIYFENVYLTSITAYREHDYFSVFDTDQSPNDWITDGSPEEQWQVSQELRLTSLGDNKLDWVAGLYFFHQESVDKAFATLGADLAPLLFGVPFVRGDVKGDQVAESIAIYLHGTYHVTDKLNLTIGSRVTYDEKELNYSQDDVAGIIGGNIPPFTDEDSWTAFTGDITLDYHWTQNTLTYAKVARGYKAGGFNDGFAQANNPSFDPEFLLSYEIGFKSQLFDNIVVFNFNIFHMQWDDIQIRDLTNVGGVLGVVTGNFGEADSTGVESELFIRPTENLDIGVTYGQSDAEFTVGNTIGTVTSGTTFPGPEFTLGLTLDYRHPIDTSGTVILHMDYQLQGDNDIIPGDPVSFQEQFGLLNGRITFQPENAKWNISVWGKNLTDEVFMVQHFDFSDNGLLGNRAIVLGNPRTYGIEINANF